MKGWIPFKIMIYVIMVMMIAPILTCLPVALTTTGYMTFPPVGFTLKWFYMAFVDNVLMTTLFRSFNLAILSSLGSVAIALFSCFAIERSQFPGKNMIETFFTGPRIIPQIIFVLGLMILYELMGLSDTFAGLFFSHLIIAMPFAFRTLLSNVISLDRRLEWSAQILGANNVQTFFRITLPQMKTGMIAAFIFTFVLSFNNVTMALFLSGVGKRTLPVEMFQRLMVGGITPSIPAISFALAVFGLVLFIVADKLVGVYRYMAG
jgi:ABC-type spermidine/putrescine transport system permease subunit II